MKEKKFMSVEINAGANNEVRKAAFAKGINRDVNLANAKKILEDIKINGYRKAELIQVIPAETVIKNGDLTLVDINEEKIAPEEAQSYYLVIDGQHRVFATSLYNEEWQKDKDPKKNSVLPVIQIPAIIVELNENETVAEYISAINVTKKEWQRIDYVRGAANVNQGELLGRYNELMNEGFSLSTLNLIFCGNSKAMNKMDLSLLCQGKTEKGTKVKKDLIPAHNIEKGNRFIELCKEKGFSMKNIARRYLIQQFQNIRNESNDERAFEIFEAITQNDRNAMYNTRQNLDESKVKEQFDRIKKRLKNKATA